jgi:hypothetical protein
MASVLSDWHPLTRVPKALTIEENGSMMSDRCRRTLTYDNRSRDFVDIFDDEDPGGMTFGR